MILPFFSVENRTFFSSLHENTSEFNIMSATDTFIIIEDHNRIWKVLKAREYQRDGLDKHIKHGSELTPITEGRIVYNIKNSKDEDVYEFIRQNGTKTFISKNRDKLVEYAKEHNNPKSYIIIKENGIWEVKPARDYQIEALKNHIESGKKFSRIERDGKPFFIQPVQFDKHLYTFTVDQIPTYISTNKEKLDALANEHNELNKRRANKKPADNLPPFIIVNGDGKCTVTSAQPDQKQALEAYILSGETKQSNDSGFKITVATDYDLSTVHIDQSTTFISLDKKALDDHATNLNKSRDFQQARFTFLVGGTKTAKQRRSSRSLKRKRRRY